MCFVSPLWTGLRRTGRYTGSRCSSSLHPNPSEAVSAPSHPPWSESAAVQARRLRSDSSHTDEDRFNQKIKQNRCSSEILVMFDPRKRFFNYQIIHENQIQFVLNSICLFSNLSLKQVWWVSFRCSDVCLTLGDALTGLIISGQAHGLQSRSVSS